MTTLADYEVLFSSPLEVKHTEEFGRGVYAKKKLSAGTELTRSQPVTHVLNNSERGHRCDRCLERREQLQKCSQCKFVRYCGSACQRNDWSHHKAECKGISGISPHVPTNTIRIIVRLLGLVKTVQSTRRSLPEGAKWELDILHSHAPRYSEELKTLLAEQLFGVKSLLSPEMEFNGSLAYELACKILSNSFSVLDSEMNSIGGGVYLVPALFNHSCDPNCIALFSGAEMSLRCVRDVQPGEQLFVSYTDMLDTRERRRKHLQKFYQFCCSCTRCEREKEPGSHSAILSSTAADLPESVRKERLAEGFKRLDEAEQLKKRTDWVGLAHLAQDYLSKWAEQLGDMNVIVIKMRECLMDACIEQQKWEEALREANNLEKVYDFYYPVMNPFTGIHAFKTAKLLQHIFDTTIHLKNSVTLLDKAVRVLSVTHGPTHPITEEAIAIMRDTQAEIAHREGVS